MARNSVDGEFTELMDAQPMTRWETPRNLRAPPMDSAEYLRYMRDGSSEAAKFRAAVQIASGLAASGDYYEPSPGHISCGRYQNAERVAKDATRIVDSILDELGRRAGAPMTPRQASREDEEKRRYERDFKNCFTPPQTGSGKPILPRDMAKASAVCLAVAKDPLNQGEMAESLEKVARLLQNTQLRAGQSG